MTFTKETLKAPRFVTGRCCSCGKLAIPWTQYELRCTPPICSYLEWFVLEFTPHYSRNWSEVVRCRTSWRLMQKGLKFKAWAVVSVRLAFVDSMGEEETAWLFLKRTSRLKISTFKKNVKIKGVHVPKRSKKAYSDESLLLLCTNLNHAEGLWRSSLPDGICTMFRSQPHWL